ncbi:hypothetical protein F5X96DRAFT_639476 [Biscogniauxia mediterranea]|nr:hypothetical protein F5X96DRAFT_639476 [Biscogniauxia mediterranea]
MAPRARSKRCEKCFLRHQKCKYSQPGSCDYCLKVGIECLPLVRGRLRSRKCDRCQRGHKQCEPVDRVWPEKCHRCSVAGYPCSPARTAPEQLEHDKRTGYLQSQQLLETDMFQSPYVGSSFELEPEPEPDSDSDSDSDSSASIPAVLPTNSKPGASKNAKTDESALHMKQTIQDMETEFADVLKSEQARFEKIINELKANHEKELKRQRERYEGRIDDLIQILKNIK